LEVDIASAKPSHVFNATGVTGRPNVDWCESHKVEIIRANIVGTLTLADVCKQSNLLLINFEQGAFFSMKKLTSLVVELVSRKTTHQFC
jgi:dTDP-4-dehydrorhamnose reductase